MAAGGRGAGGAAVALGALAALGAVLLAVPAALLLADIALAIVFLAWLGLRLATLSAGWSWCDRGRDPPDHELPVYTVIAALYREAASLDALLAAIERLHYPREKLDVILAVEADDRETRAALTHRRSRLPVTVISVPLVGPRTKPKALNVALPFARGAFTVIYDAEDRPEPDQLRRALRAFRAGGERLACVQARLCIDNTEDGWLARGIMAQTPQAFG